jgi:hypothetical protein
MLDDPRSNNSIEEARVPIGCLAAVSGRHANSPHGLPRDSGESQQTLPNKRRDGWPHSPAPIKARRWQCQGAEKDPRSARPQGQYCLVIFGVDAVMVPSRLATKK